MDTPAYLFPEMTKWLLILSILARLYTSVIPRNPENNVLEVSWATDMSPTALFALATCPCGSDTEPELYLRGCTRGGDLRVGREGYTGTPPVRLQDPYLTLI